MKKLIIILSLLVGTLHAQSAKEIIQTADNRVRGNTSYIEMTIEISRAKWSKTMAMKSWSKGSNKALSLITSPAKEKGTVFLMRDKEVWNYVPSIDRSIKMPPSMMLQNWMGTDLTNDDLIKQSSMVVDYSQKILGDEKIGDLTCWKIELTPNEDASVVWGKILIWIDKSDFMQMKTEFYDEDEFLINSMTASEIKSFDGKRLPSKLTIVPEDKEGNKTVITYQVMQFNQTIDDSKFTTQSMKRVK